MPTRNVNLTDELDCFVAYQVKSGRYENGGWPLSAVCFLFPHQNLWPAIARLGRGASSRPTALRVGRTSPLGEQRVVSTRVFNLNQLSEFGIVFH
jgi:hypothetical protein